LNDILRNVLLPRLATLRKLRFGYLSREYIRNLLDAGDGLVGGDQGDDLGEGWRVGSGLLLDLRLVVGSTLKSHFRSLRR
jgi:hypothetical protein